MNRLIACLTVATICGCASPDRNKVSLGAVNESTRVVDGKVVTTTIDRSGQTAAGGGAVADTSEAKILAALAAKLEGKEFTYASATRSSIDQPNVNVEQEIETKHKQALSDAGKALAAGASGDYSKALAEAASLGGQLLQARAARANGPKADQGAISTRVLSSGDGHGETARAMAHEFGETLRAAERASYGVKSNEIRTDITTTNDLQAVVDALKAIGRPAAKPASVSKEAARKPEGATVKPASTNAPNASVTATNAVPAKVSDKGLNLSDEEAQAIIGKMKAKSGTFLDGTNPADKEVLRLVKMYGDRITHFGGGNAGRARSESYLWKGKSDSNGNLVVITPSSKFVESVSVGGEKQTSLSIGNGWRPHFRLSKPGPSYGSKPELTVTPAGKATITNTTRLDGFKVN